MHAHAPRPDAGFTLISMLVGLVIGILSITAMLVMYRVLIATSSQVKGQAATEGELATSSVASQEQLQQAGFGVTGAALGTDLVLLSNAALAGGKLTGTAATSYGATITGNAVIWGYNPTGASATFNPASYVCEGLIVTASGLQWLAPVGCSNAAQWQSLSWQAPHQLAASKTSIGTVSNFVVAPATCWPYGQTTAISSVQVSYFLLPQSSAVSSAPATASTASSAQYNAIPVFSVCLPNFNL